MKQEWKLPEANNKNLVCYTNARIIDPYTKTDIKNGQLVVENGLIKDFGTNILEGSAPEGMEIIDCAGLTITPGLIDIQVHFREPGQTHKEDLHSGSKSAAAGGITSVVCQPNTSPVIDNLDTLDLINYRAREKSFINIKCYAAISKGMKGQELSDMGKLVEAGIVGFTDDGLPVMNAKLMRNALEYSSMFNVPIVQHAEDLQLSAGGCMHEGEVSFELGLKGIPSSSEAVMVARDILLLKSAPKTARYHVLHVSTKDALEAIKWGKEMGLNVTCEAAPHHFTLTDRAVIEHGTNAKMNPPLRGQQDMEAILEGLKSGLIDAIATDHAPHDIDSKNKPMQEATFGIVGLETMLPISLELVFKHGMNLIDVLAKLTYKPADIINLDRGRIAKGKVADLTFIDLDHEWIIDINKFSSKSKNSPYHGRRVKGLVRRTLVAGNEVYSCF